MHKLDERVGSCQYLSLIHIYKWGPVVAIEDASGRIWRVCGTTDAKVKKGDTVSAGQTIGKVGSVSCECAEESHIHLEVMEGEKYLDPIKAMK